MEGALGIPFPLAMLLTTDDSGVMGTNMIPSTYKVHLVAKEVEDYSFEVTIKLGETSTVEIALDPVEEIEFVRLPKEELWKLQQACKQPDLWSVIIPARYENEKQWADAWAAFKLAAPKVDFQKWRVVGFLTHSSQGLPELSVLRVTFNPRTKAIRTRTNDIKRGDFYTQVIDCKADFVLIPVREGMVLFR